MNQYIIFRIGPMVEWVDNVGDARGVYDAERYLKETYLYDSAHGERYLVVNRTTGEFFEFRVEAEKKLNLVNSGGRR